MASLTRLSDEQQDVVDSAVNSGAYLGWRKYRSYFTISDARQIAWEWVLSHKRQVTELLEDGERGRRRLVTRISVAVAKAGRSEKAVKIGYDPDDEYFYSAGVLELVLPALWDEQYRPWTQEDASGRRQTTQTYYDWESMVLDVKLAVERAGLSQEERTILTLRYRDRLLLTQIASIFEVSEGTIRNRLKSIMRVLQHTLGGPEPRPCPDGCDECSHVGQRRAISNAAARAATDSHYDPS